jgi:hypothetical protein
MNITIPEPIYTRLIDHLFQSDLEQGAFLFGEMKGSSFVTDDLYGVPSSGWDVQLEVYLEMKDAERLKIMRMAVDRQCGIIDCHSHPGASDDVWFSPSDIAGITAFAQYAKWKLRGQVYVATVWGESSVDAVSWSGAFDGPTAIEAVEITGATLRRLVPTGSWFREPRAHRRKDPVSD